MSSNSNKINLFKSSAFLNLASDCLAMQISKQANLILEKEAGPVVYGSIAELSWTIKQSPSDTKRAYLFQIESLVKEPCKHESTIINYTVNAPKFPITAKCLSCGALLKPNWEVVK